MFINIVDFVLHYVTCAKNTKDACVKGVSKKFKKGVYWIFFKNELPKKGGHFAKKSCKTK